MSDPTSLPAGARGDQLLAGRYRLIRPLASGGMAQVWEAEDEILGRPVAVKILHPHLASDASFVARFRAEAINAARLTHPGIVSIYDTWSDGSTEAIVMELVRGTTLRHLLDHRGALAPDEAVTIADHIAASLEAAHRAGIVHRDIKPANVLLSSDGRVMVTDFGIAKAVESADLTAEATMLGTAKYLAPEQVEGGPVDGRTDLYALGVVLYEMLAGEVPFRADTETATALARLHRMPEAPSRLRPGLAAGLDSVVLHCLSRNAIDRPASAGDLRRELASGTRDSPTTVAPVPPSAQNRAPQPHVAPSSPASAMAPTAPPRVPPTLGAVPDVPPRPVNPWRRRGRWLVTGLVATAVIVSAVLAVAIARGGTGDSIVPIRSAQAFDPLGRPPGEENNAAAPRAVDGDPATDWFTERYRDPANLGKPGVGLIVQLDSTRRLSAIEVASPSANWSAAIYAVQGSPAGSLDGWGEPIATGEGLGPGPVRFRIDRRRAEAILIWITRVGDDGRVRIADVVATGR